MSRKEAEASSASAGEPHLPPTGVDLSFQRILTQSIVDYGSGHSLMLVSSRFGIRWKIPTSVVLLSLDARCTGRFCFRRRSSWVIG